MREFVFGSDRQYEFLKESLEDGLCHVYRPCVFPQGCSVPTGRIGFEKDPTGYALFIDTGITCSRRSAPPLFQEWLQKGTLRFMDFTDMKVFLRSLKGLYR